MKSVNHNIITEIKSVRDLTLSQAQGFLDFAASPNTPTFSLLTKDKTNKLTLTYTVEDQPDSNGMIPWTFEKQLYCKTATTQQRYVSSTIGHGASLYSPNKNEVHLMMIWMGFVMTESNHLP